MIERFLIPVAAGFVSAVTFVSVALGHPGFGVLLYVIIPLPILLAGLALGWRAAATAAVAASLLIFATASPLAAVAFACGQALPPVALSYLALLRRPAADPSAIDWYPPGRLVIAAAVIGSLLSLAVVIALGGTHAAIKESVAPGIESLIKDQVQVMPQPSPINAEDIPKIADAAVTLLPAMMAVTAMALLLVNLWLAGRVTLAAGHLQRPWPDLALLEFPRGTPLAFAVATAAGFLPDLPGMAGNAVSGALFFGYVLLGLAVIHYVTRGVAWRTAALPALYFALLFFNPALLIVAAVGLFDTIWPLRRPPPS